MSRAANNPGNGERPDIVRYDTPEFTGFYGLAAWGEDDMWDAALRFEKEVRRLRTAFRVGYAEYYGRRTRASCYGTERHRPATVKCREFGGSGTIWHKPTGLYVYGAYGQNEDDRDEALALPAAVDDEDKLLLRAGRHREEVASRSARPASSRRLPSR